MRIVIDLQAAQTPASRHRGIGRYSMSLAKAMLRHRGPHQILVALNGMYGESLDAVRAELAGLIDPADIRVWHATQPPCPLSGGPAGYRQAAEEVREAFLASLEADIVHVASMFEGNAFSVTGSGKGGGRHRTAVTLYDLIPHIYPDVYLPTPGMAAEYEEKLAHLRGADLWLAISASSRTEGIERLGLAPSRVVNISSAADPQFTPARVDPEREAALRQKYGLWRPFVMYTGGIDHRKNIEGLIRAWALLPAPLRAAHQLAVVCSAQPQDVERLNRLAGQSGFAESEYVMTGFVPEEDLIDLYRLCKLFVFPSRHEGFGLPALEAMRCGAPVIGADNSSIPEVIGRPEALFDARSDAAIAARMRQCLEDERLLEDLARHGLQQAQKFSWDQSARTALAAFERLIEEPAPAASPVRRPRLAYVSPMPPERSGISDYSAELLPALAAHYDIDLILEQPTLDPLPPGCFAAQRGAGWFLDHGQDYDRILYHFGNSAFHAHMFELLARHPGTVVLHDFFLSGLQAHRELQGGGTTWTRALYESHGWHAVRKRFGTPRLEEVIHEFPANFEVLRAAQGVIVHSPFSAVLARQWYGAGAVQNWAEIPHLRVPLPRDREGARRELGLGPDDFLVCAFGIMGPTKMNHRLAAAWSASAMARRPNCRLVFVGENHPGDYGKEMLRAIEQGGGTISITGWADQDVFRRYLNAADVAVQLRTLSRGETSGTVLDAMNHGVPVVANANGSMAYLSREAAVVLEEDFSDEELTEALEALWGHPARRHAMGEAGRRLIETLHSPADCAQAYARAIEGFAARAAYGPARLVWRVAQALPEEADAGTVAAFAQAISRNHPEPVPARQILVDVTAWMRGRAAPTGEPGQEGPPPPLPPFLNSLLTDAPAPGWRVEPVYLDTGGAWRYARTFALRQLRCPPHLLADEAIELRAGDAWCTLESEEQAPPLPADALELGLRPLKLPHDGHPPLAWAGLGATAPVLSGTQWFLDISELVRHDWQSGIQRVVKNYLLELMTHPPAGVTIVPVYATPEEDGYRVAERYVLGLAGIGADPVGRPIAPRAGDVFFGLDLQPHIVARQWPVLQALQRQGVHLAFMVYDLLPVQLPDCFSQGALPDHEHWLRLVTQADLLICISNAVAAELREWMQGQKIARKPEVAAIHLGADLTHGLSSRGMPQESMELVEQVKAQPSFLMVGTIEPRKSHAQVLDGFERLWSWGDDATLVIVGRPGWMTEPLVQRLRNHPERGQRLIWVENASDELLEHLYRACTCLIAASRGEGFGLPLIEAAQRALPIIARDLPVFREVAGDHAFYFHGPTPQAIASAVTEWRALKRQGAQPRSEGIEWMTWAQSAARLRDGLAAHHWRQPPAA